MDGSESPAPARLHPSISACALRCVALHLLRGLHRSFPTACSAARVARPPPPHAAREEENDQRRAHAPTHARTHASRLRSGRDGRIGWGGMRSGSRNPHPEFKTPRRAAVQCSDVTARPRAAPEEAAEQASSRARRSTVARATWAAAVCAATCSVGGRINDASGKVGEGRGAEQSRAPSNGLRPASPTRWRIPGVDSRSTSIRRMATSAGTAGWVTINGRPPRPCPTPLPTHTHTHDDDEQRSRSAARLRPSRVYGDE
jgi:hypothetical protein